MNEATEFICPRRDEVPTISGFATTDSWVHGNCSFCGSLNPDLFMKYIKLEGTKVEPTDKNYKCYLRGNEFSTLKFYFRHLSCEQKDEFISLLNKGEMVIDYPGRFYVTPYFCVKTTESVNTSE